MKRRQFLALRIDIRKFPILAVWHLNLERDFLLRKVVIEGMACQVPSS